MAAADGKVFVSLASAYDAKTSFFALDNTDGSILWSKGFSDAYAVYPPSYAYGNVYIQSGKGGDQTAYLFSFDAGSGELLFQNYYSTQWHTHYAPTICNGNIYFNGGYTGGMYSYDAFDGSSNWFADIDFDKWTPAVDNDFAYAYIGTQHGVGLKAGLHIFDRITGQLAGSILDPNYVWVGWSMNLGPVLGSGNNVLVGQNGRLICFDLEHKSIRYEVRDAFGTQPSAAHGCVYIINGGKLDVRDELTGVRLWTWTPPEGVLAGPVIVTDSHVFTSTATTCHAIKISTCQCDWSYPAGGHLAIGNQTLYIASASGVLTAISVPSLY